MKGVFLHDGVEYKLEITGDELRQGDSVPCALVLKNHTSEPRRIPPLLQLSIALGNAKKVRGKAEGAFEIIEAIQMGSVQELGPSGQRLLEARFELDRNAPITDKAQGLFVLIGSADSVASIGQLPLGIQPHPYLISVFETLDTVFQFVPKGITSKAGWTTAKMNPPSARRLSLVDELNLSIRFHEDSLELKYLFTVKKFETGAVKLDVRKDKAEVLQQWAAELYLFGGQFIQQEFVEASIAEALEEVSTVL